MTPIDLKAEVSEYREWLVRKALKAARGDQQTLARLLTLSIRAARYWERRLGITDKRKRK